MTTPTFNIHSVTKTNLYRDMRNRILADPACQGMSEADVRTLIGPMVQAHLNQKKQRETAMKIAASMLQNIGTTQGLVVTAGGKVVSKDASKAKATKGKRTRKGVKANNYTRKRSPEEMADVKLLMELFHRAFHEQNLDKTIIATALGVSTATISNWLSISVQPADRNLKPIIKFLAKFGCYTVPQRFNTVKYSGE